MPHYRWSRDEDGTSNMERMDAEFKKKPLREPDGVDLDIGADKITVHKCTLCENTWRIVAPVARHFKGTHPDEYENDDSWRDFHEEVRVAANS